MNKGNRRHNQPQLFYVARDDTDKKPSEMMGIMASDPELRNNPGAANRNLKKRRQNPNPTVKSGATDSKQEKPRAEVEFQANSKKKGLRNEQAEVMKLEALNIISTLVRGEAVYKGEATLSALGKLINLHQPRCPLLADILVSAWSQHQKRSDFKWDAKEKDRFLSFVSNPILARNNIWCRSFFMALETIMKDLNSQQDDGELQSLVLERWTQFHFGCIPSCFKCLNLKKLVREEDVLATIRSHLKSKNYGAASKFIVFFELEKHFNLQELAKEMIDNRCTMEAANLDPKNPEFQAYIQNLRTESRKKQSIKATPAEEEKKGGQEVRVHITAPRGNDIKQINYFAKTHPIHLLEDRYKYNKRLLGIAVSRLLAKLSKRSDFTLDAVASIAARHKLLEGGYISQSKHQHLLMEQLQSPDYREAPNLLDALDKFGVTEDNLDKCKGEKFLRLDDYKLSLEKNVVFIDDLDGERFAVAQNDIVTSKLIGLDTEFLSDMGKDDPIAYGAAILQISTQNGSYIFDTVKLAKDGRFKDFLNKIFLSEEIIKIAHSFENDANELVKRQVVDIPQGRKFVEIQKMFLALNASSKKHSLAHIVEVLLGKQLSKYEQLSGWLNRPLRKAQLHYAALDSHVLLVIYNILENQAGENLQQFILEAMRINGEAPNTLNQERILSGDPSKKEGHRGKRAGNQIKPQVYYVEKKPEEEKTT